jgi:hypothetical protein
MTLIMIYGSLAGLGQKVRLDRGSVVALVQLDNLMFHHHASSAFRRRTVASTPSISMKRAFVLAQKGQVLLEKTTTSADATVSSIENAAAALKERATPPRAAVGANARAENKVVAKRKARAMMILIVT